MFREDPETYPFWTEHQAELGLIRIGLTESFLECLEEEVVGVDFLVARGVARKGDTIVLLHTGGRDVDVKAPFAMEVVTINDEVVQDPRLIHSSPYFEGWLGEVRRRS